MSVNSDIDTQDRKESGNEDEAEKIQPFIIKSIFPYQRVVTFPLLIALIVGAHLGMVSYLWAIVLFSLEILPSEAIKIHKYGLSEYLGSMNIKLPTISGLGIVCVGVIAMFLLLVGITQAAEHILNIYPTGGGGHLLGTIELTPAITLLLVIFMYIVVGPLEEYFFRHKLQNFMKSVTEIHRAVLLTNVLFSLPHLLVFDLSGSMKYNAVGLFAIFCIGCVLSVQYEYTDNLTVPSLTHSTYNSLLLLSLLL